MKLCFAFRVVFIVRTMHTPVCISISCACCRDQATGHNAPIRNPQDEKNSVEGAIKYMVANGVPLSKVTLGFVCTHARDALAVFMEQISRQYSVFPFQCRLNSFHFVVSVPRPRLVTSVPLYGRVFNRADPNTCALWKPADLTSKTVGASTDFQCSRATHLLTYQDLQRTWHAVRVRALCRGVA